ncbi:MAG: hypothetical protein J0I84_12965 [Terrimonas sp.]|uniref:hypothetical protein n=1 Tax=Terrimonas sp. TaxID=1914338 RepID=UPI00092859CC|nr:hypothetical protein [Terrimonas sp.]MBN8787993.1 hypothetical protein [Terrimonas sp.]OJY98138.1 MAG: hypothetical protein BGP13_10840 [Sphingobacteriales bacterium 40-81]PVD50536.1 hypothetical protein DC498_19105 [Terrimonas sp.]
MKIRIAIILLIVIVVSCSKDTFNSKPSLKLKETSGDYVPLDGNYGVQFTLEYTDAEGDIAGVPIYLQKLSSSAPCADNTKDPTYLDSSYTLPADVPLSANQKGAIVITISDLLLNRIACDPLDTLEDATFKFWFKDQAGNVSDTVTSPVIKIEKQP